MRTLRTRNQEGKLGLPTVRKKKVMRVIKTTLKNNSLSKINSSARAMESTILDDLSIIFQDFRK